MARSAVLDGWLGLSRALRKGSISAANGERIALGVAEANECSYCLSVHSYLGANVAKLDADELEQARHFQSSDPKAAAILAFAEAVVRTTGGVSDNDIQAARDAGLTTPSSATWSATSPQRPDELLQPCVRRRRRLPPRRAPPARDRRLKRTKAPPGPASALTAPRPKGDPWPHESAPSARSTKRRPAEGPARRGCLEHARPRARRACLHRGLAVAKPRRVLPRPRRHPRVPRAQVAARARLPLRKELWAFTDTASPSASSTSRATPTDSGGAATATSTGSSTRPAASCAAATPASTTTRSPP